jgi:hypothetical protein
MDINTNRLQEIFEQEDNITKTAKKYCQEVGVEYTDSFRRTVSNKLNKETTGCDNDLENETETDTVQYNVVSQLSALKHDGTIMNIKEYCDVYKIPYDEVRTYKLVTHNSKGAYYNIASNPLKGDAFNEFYDRLLKEIAELPNLPIKTKLVPQVGTESYLLVLDPCDIHIGKLSEVFETGDEYNSNIAVQRVLEGIEGIIEKVKGFPIDQILFVLGNDILHTDNAKRTTTSGTPQDTHLSWYSNFLLAKQLYIDIIDRISGISNVHCSFNPSNHDFVHGFFLADVIKTYFKGCEGITFDTDLRHRKYFTYHNNLIGLTHGDGAKTVDLGPLMAHEAEDWGKCKHRYIYTHHTHHKTAKDYIGVTVESLRSPSGTDAWHDRNGYSGVPKAIEGFLHSKTQGQIARITHIF